MNYEPELRSLGLTEGILFSVSNDYQTEIVDIYADCGSRKGVVYAAFRLSDGVCIKIGKTKSTTVRRWKGIINMIDQSCDSWKLRQNEINDQTILREISRGHNILIWFGEPFDIEAKTTNSSVRKIRSLEFSEIFLDHAFRPLFGMDLSGRNL